MSMRFYLIMKIKIIRFEFSDIYHALRIASITHLRAIKNCFAYRIVGCDIDNNFSSKEFMHDLKNFIEEKMYTSEFNKEKCFECLSDFVSFMPKDTIFEIFNSGFLIKSKKIAVQIVLDNEYIAVEEI